MTQPGEICLMMDTSEGVPYRLAEPRAAKPVIESKHQLQDIPGSICLCLTRVLLWPPPSPPRVGNFRQKNYSAEDRIDRTIGLFWRNYGCSRNRKFSEFRSELFRGTTRNSVPWNKNISKHLEFYSEPFRERDNNSEFRNNACLGQKQAVNYVCWSMIFCKKKFFHDISFHSELWNRHFCKLRNASEWALSSVE